MKTSGKGDTSHNKGHCPPDAAADGKTNEGYRKKTTGMSVETSCSRIDMAQDRKENVASQEFDDRAMLLGTDLTFGVARRTLGCAKKDGGWLAGVAHPNAMHFHHISGSNTPRFT
mmetsp:Transcript_17204/g.42196  ORF Transcript_17204/g.42196 Transcript_17204/m.42196 type:complete len:115 (-) Transcript_17204:274-618(-)